MENIEAQLNLTAKIEKQANIVLSVSRITILLWFLIYVIVYGYKFNLLNNPSEGSGFGFVIILSGSFIVSLFLAASSVVCSIGGFLVLPKLENFSLRKKILIFSTILPLVVVVTSFLVRAYILGIFK